MKHYSLVSGLLCPVKSVRTLTALAAVSLLSSSGYAAWTAPSSYKNPTTTITIGDSGYGANNEDDSAVFQKAIDMVNTSGGGHVIVPPGDYKISEVQLKSEVHIKVQKGATLHPYTPDTSKRTHLFEIGMAENTVENTSISGTNGRGKVVLPYNTDGLRFVKLGDVNNFLINKFNINDTRSTYSAIILTWRGTDADGIMHSPSNGTISSCTLTDAHYGYGLIQAHSAVNILFKKLKSTGGVAVRLETGLPVDNVAAHENGFGHNGLHDIIVDGATSVNGQSAVMMQCHTIDHGDVTIKNVTATGSEFAVSIESGFVSKSKYLTEGSKYHTPDITIGSWQSVTIDGVKATYQNNEIVTRYVHLDHYPVELHPLIYKVVGDDWPGEPTYRGPSIAAVYNGLDGNGDVSIRNVTATGYQYLPAITTHDDLYTGSLKHITQMDPVAP